MREVITYYAFDDTPFNTEAECAAYENEHSNRFKRIMENVVLFDKNNCPASFENENEFFSIYEDCHFLIVRNDLKDDDTAFLGERGYIDIPHEKGFYHIEDFDWTEFHKSWGPLIPYIIGEKSI